MPKARVETSDTRLRNIGCSQSMRKLPAFGVVAVAMSAFGKCGRKTACLLQNRLMRDPRIADKVLSGPIRKIDIVMANLEGVAIGKRRKIELIPWIQRKFLVGGDELS